MKNEIEPKATSVTAESITDKRGYAARWHFSIRKVSDLLSQGLPHCKIGQRRVRIIVSEADAWMKEQFHTQRRSQPQNSNE